MVTNQYKACNWMKYFKNIEGCEIPSILSEASVPANYYLMEDVYKIYKMKTDEQLFDNNDFPVLMENGVSADSAYYYVIYLPVNKNFTEATADRKLKQNQEGITKEEINWIAYAWPKKYNITGRYLLVISNESLFYFNNANAIYSGDNIPSFDIAFSAIECFQKKDFDRFYADGWNFGLPPGINCVEEIIKGSILERVLGTFFPTNNFMYGK